MNDNRVTIHCEDCGTEFRVSVKRYRARTIGYLKDEPGFKWRCTKCRSKASSAAHSEGQRKRWAKLDDNDKKKAMELFLEGKKKYYDNFKENKKEFGEKVRQGQLNMKVEDRNRMLINRGISRKAAWNLLTPEERKAKMHNQHEGSKQWWATMDDSTRIKFLDNLHQNASLWRNSLSDEEFALHMHKSIVSSNGSNRFHQRTKDMFMILKYNFQEEYISIIDGIKHSWDFAIFDNEHNLVCVIDLDGAYYHADNCDYDGIHSKLEYDIKRGLSAPQNVKIFIIYEDEFEKSINLLQTVLFMEYNKYIDFMIQMYQCQPFPSPHYSDIELMASYNKLARSSLVNYQTNSRLGDRIIYHFHESFWNNHENNMPSSFEIWQMPEILQLMITNGLLYHNFINKNKILQCFILFPYIHLPNIIAPIQIKTVIEEFFPSISSIFDPCIHYSEILLAAISSNIIYVGLTDDKSKFNESTSLVEFLRKNAIQANANILESYAPSVSHEFLCNIIPFEVNPDLWIENCINKFKCDKYLFIAYDTVKYRDNIILQIYSQIPSIDPICYIAI